MPSRAYARTGPPLASSPAADWRIGAASRVVPAPAGHGKGRTRPARTSRPSQLRTRARPRLGWWPHPGRRDGQLAGSAALAALRKSGHARGTAQPTAGVARRFPRAPGIRGTPLINQRAKSGRNHNDRFCPPSAPAVNGHGEPSAAAPIGVTANRRYGRRSAVWPGRECRAKLGRSVPSATSRWSWRTGVKLCSRLARM